MKISIDLREATPEQRARFEPPQLQTTLDIIRAAVSDENAPVGVCRWIPGRGPIEVLHVVQSLADLHRADAHDAEHEPRLPESYYRGDDVPDLL